MLRLFLRPNLLLLLSLLLLWALNAWPDPIHLWSDTSNTGWPSVFVLLLLILCNALWPAWIGMLLIKQKRLKGRNIALNTAFQKNAAQLRLMNDDLNRKNLHHKQTEELLRDTQDYLNCIINSMPSVLITMTPTGTITHWNTSAVTLTNLTAAQVLGKQLDEVFPELNIPEDAITLALQSRTAQVRENIIFKCLHQADKHVDITLYPLLSHKNSGVVIRIDDVTMRIQMETMMVQNEKMLSLGELAAGMAHEINNPLCAILQGVQNIKRRTLEQLPKNCMAAENADLKLTQIEQYFKERKIFEFLSAIQEAGERASFIVKNMLEFARSGHQHQWIDLNRLIRQTVELARRSIAIDNVLDFRNIDLQLHLNPDLPPVPCSWAEMQQVVLNLLTNAAYALSADSQLKLESKIEIKTYCDTKEYVIIQISDNGPGMGEHVLRHLFEPFFTTKDVGRGTGLGLSISYFIIKKRHQGDIKVHSLLGQGTDFFIELPLCLPGQKTIASKQMISEHS